MPFECSWPCLPLPPERAPERRQDARAALPRPHHTSRCRLARPGAAGWQRGGKICRGARQVRGEADTQKFCSNVCQVRAKTKRYRQRVRGNGAASPATLAPIEPWPRPFVPP